jgi:putative phosphoribosyl transferase
MSGDAVTFRDRKDAGRRLAAALQVFAGDNPLVLALPRGGVPVAFEVARAFHAPLDVILVRKIGAPGHSEYGIGAVVDGENPHLVLNEEAMAVVQPPPGYVEAERDRQLAEIERRRDLYLGGRQAIPATDRTVIVVDDGIATGGTAKVALETLRKEGAARLVLAVPVAPEETLERLQKLADEIVCLSTPRPFHAVGLYYDDFDQVGDDTVVRLLRETQSRG